ncbi:RluA family pseudouridine synthase [Cohnella endophytica]|uniref:Pseudouridine synthase n=1 Tax=Cohnella endophytica TaxID=2419778 RepID=A0A494XE20_9BACL|nr:RluA family pseudouridine synthase [Cohnella endophytica]RKP45853.1 RluA family pseudouridine synthase [Cohnella endophytica]
MSGAGRNRQRGGSKPTGGNDRNGSRGRGGSEAVYSGTGARSGLRSGAKPGFKAGAGGAIAKKIGDRPPQGGRKPGRPRDESFGKANRRGQVASPAGSKSGGGSASLIGMGRIKGEWMDIRLPDHLVGAPMAIIARHLPLPPKHLTKLMQTKGCILQGPNLRLHLFPRENRDFPSDWMELNILYEDEFTLIVNKPAGIEVHPSEKGQRKTLAHAVAAYYEMSGQDIRIRHVHRIDKDTTGPVLYAKNEFAHYQYDKAMREKTIERIYVALAEGYVEGNKGKIDKPIGQDRHHSTRRRVSDTGDPAVTHFEVVERFDDHTLVRLRLETGRTHQIRVHLSSINHPLAGDGLYGGKRGVISRQALHGERLIWSHPWTGEKQQISAPLPDDIAQSLNKLRHK